MDVAPLYVDWFSSGYCVCVFYVGDFIKVMKYKYSREIMDSKEQIMISSFRNRCVAWWLCKLVVTVMLMLLSASVFAFGDDYVKPRNEREVLLKGFNSLEFQGQEFVEEELNLLFEEYNIIHIEEVYPQDKSFRWYLVRMDSNIDFDDLFARAKKVELIEHIQRNGLSRMNRIPNDPMFSEQRFIFDMINAPQAWELETGSEQVIVAVIDSGILLLPDLQDNVFINEAELPENYDRSRFIDDWINKREIPRSGVDSDGNGFVDDWMGWNFVDAPSMAHVAQGRFIGRCNDVTDDLFHGTHVSGIIASDTNNGVGIAGTAWNIRLLPIRAGFRAAGGGYLQADDTAAAILYATNMGANIINCSWGSTEYSQIIRDAIDYAVDRGVIVVAAAGNTWTYGVNYPAKFNNVIAVGAVDNNKRRAWFSSYGPELDVVAPGVNILSTWNESINYNRQNGTSMAAPFVSGAIALLLSREPGLDVFQVRERLIASSEPLGASSFDFQFGHGLLNMRKLLEVNPSEAVNITFPLDYQVFDEEFAIVGTAKSDRFFRYSLMYTNVLAPQEVDWLDIHTHHNSPQHFFTPVENGVLGRFNLAFHFEDGAYLLRLRLQTTDGRNIDQYLTFTIDRDLPRLIENTIKYQKRYDGHRVEHYVFTLWNKPVSINMAYRVGNFTGQVASTGYHQFHVLRVDNNFATGNLSVRFSATDLKGRTITFPMSPMGQIDWIDMDTHIANEETPNTGFAITPLGDALFLARNAIDFNRNGRPEFIAMNQNNVMHSYEFIQNGLRITSLYNVVIDENTTHTVNFFSETAQPLDMTTGRQNRNSLAALRQGDLQIYQSLPLNPLPAFALQSKIDNVSGAIFANFTRDEYPNLITVKDMEAYVGIEIYREGEYRYESSDIIIRNAVQTAGRRMFVPKIQAGYLDDNDYLDLLTADEEGNIMIYEFIDGEVVLSWTTRIGVPNVYFLEIGNFTSPDTKSFIAGGYITSNEMNKTWWHFELFEATGDTLRYKSLGSIAFSTVQTGQNSIFAVDLNNDGQDEIILAITPYLYVIRYTEARGLFPVFWTYSDNSYQIGGLPRNNFHNAFVVFNRTENNVLGSFALTYDTPFTGPETPRNLRAEFVNEEFVKLEWDAVSADFYNVYCKIEENDSWILKASNIVINEFIDHEIPDSRQIIYAVSAVRSGQESFLSFSAVANLEPIARFYSVRMIGRRELLLTFDRAMHSSSTNMMFYSVSHGVGHPSSVHFMDENRTLYLVFFNDFPAVSDLTISFSGLRDINNKELSAEVRHIRFEIDTEPPFVVSYELLRRNQVAIYFSERLDASGASNAANFVLEAPVQDINNFISSVAFRDSVVVLTFANNIVTTVEPYYVTMSNIRDLSGNLMTNQNRRITLNLTEITSLNYLVVYPNPINTNNIEAVKFMNIPDTKRGEVRIFNVGGELVFRQNIEGVSTFSWNVSNNSGNRVSAGLYHYLIRMGNESRRGQIVVVR